MPAARAPAAPRLPARLTPGPAACRLADALELTGVELHEPRCEGRSAANARLEEVAVAGGDLRGAHLVDARLTDVVVRDANLANMVIRGGLLARVEIVRCRLTGLAIAEADVGDLVCRECAADLAMLRHATLTRVTFEACTLRGADFMGARCDHVRFSDCDLTGASFTQAQFADSEFVRCRMDDVEGVAGLRGTAMEVEQMLTLAPAFAAALGIAQIPPEPPGGV